jgi:hypothetical protein
LHAQPQQSGAADQHRRPCQHGHRKADDVKHNSADKANEQG